MSTRTIDLCVIGGGAAGLSVAAAAGLLGAAVVLIERARMGGECLNTGCVPSKALLAAAHAAHAAQRASVLGIDASPRVDFGRVHDHVHAAIAAIAPHDSVERMAQYGVDVVRASARLRAPRVVEADGVELRARRLVIATGAEPAVPDVPGIADVPILTNETIFDCTTRPRHLLVLGGGPLGIEMAQAYRRLGAAVTVVARSRALPKDDPDVAAILLQALARDGIAIREHAHATKIERAGDDIVMTIDEAGESRRVEASHLLVATGRRPRVSGLGLEAAGVVYDDDGIAVDARLRTSAKGVYAAGDVVAGPRFTHVCSYHAGVIVQNALFRLPARVRYDSLPWVTYTDPELAQIGMTEARARERRGDDLRVVRVPYADSDRAQAERRPEGLLKLVARPDGRLLGASIVGAHAGELAHLFVLAIERRLNLRHVARMIAPYPTFAELDRTAAIEFLKPWMRATLTRRVVRLLSRLP